MERTDQLERRCFRWAEEAMYWRENSDHWQRIAEESLEVADRLQKQLTKSLGNTGMPACVMEALNSGDGVYRP